MVSRGGIAVTRDIAAIVVVRETSAGLFDPVAFCGTGFVIGPGLLVTCWHCVRDGIPEGCQYAAVLQNDGAGFAVVPLANISQDSSGVDLATANLNWIPALGLKLALRGVPAGTPVFAVGHARTELTSALHGGPVLRFEPQYLQGYVTRDLRFRESVYGETPSYEVDLPTPPGLSGAPLVSTGSTEVLGVIYGTNDFERVVQFATVDEASGRRDPEVIRVVSFGLAHHTTTLRRLAGSATRGQPLEEYLGLLREGHTGRPAKADPSRRSSQPGRL